ncbi:TOBE domain-containing protein, partial [Candidatus Calescamantes bacterium]|nr:TOBE domain-containing protein [Candidatus Calescamantes bacterium]
DAKPFTTLKSTADVIEPMGSEIYIYFKVENTTFTGRFSPKLRVKIGDKIDVVVDMESIHFFDIDTEETIV